MLIIVGKATPNEQPGHEAIEFYLAEFRQMLQRQGQFVYAWSFNPDDRAIGTIQEYINNNDDIFLYLPADRGLSNLRMHIINFFHNRDGINTCPADWAPYCVDDLQGELNWGPSHTVHIWFLIDAIDDLDAPVDLRNAFVPVFPDGKYATWGMNYFAFLQPA